MFFFKLILQLFPTSNCPDFTKYDEIKCYLKGKSNKIRERFRENLDSELENTTDESYHLIDSLQL